MLKPLLGALLLCSLVCCPLFATAHAAYKLPDTGQTKCYQAVDPYAEIPCAGTGQDGAYSNNPLSYTDNGNGTITDNNTGLTWQQGEGGQKTWGDAETYCGGLSLAGGGWRLPSKKELISIVDYGISSGPTIRQVYFPNATSSDYWSSTTYANNPGNAWYVYFNDGGVLNSNKDGINYVRCVRGGQ